MDPNRRQLPSGTVLGGSGVLPEQLANDVKHIIIGIGGNAVGRRLTARATELGLELVSAVHPRSTIAPSVRIGRGTVVMAGAVVNSGARIGDNVIMNTCASVDHDCVIDDGVHVCSVTHLAGNVRVGDETFIGIGSAVRERIRIGRECVIGAGSALLRDLPDHVLAMGSPPRVVRDLIETRAEG